MPLAGHPLFRTRDLDEAREEVARIFCPHRLELVGRDAALDAVHNSARLETVGLNYLSYGGPVRITPGALESFYLVQIPLRGSAEIVQGREAIRSTPATASVLSPVEPIDMRWSRDNPQLIVRVEREGLERQLEALLRRPLREPLRFELGMPLRGRAGASWLRLVGLLREEIEQGGALVSEPLALARVEELLLTTLLLAQPSNHSRLLEAAAPAALPRRVARAVELVHARAGEPLTVAELARAAGVSVRSLQAGFRRHLGASPSGYLRDVRLTRAREELQAADPGATSVTEVALRWGFPHGGRFAQAYRRRFGELPSRTLRS